jgi:hypothetical protein
MLSAATGYAPYAQSSRVDAISTAQAGEMQTALPPLKVLGTYLYDPTLISAKSLSPAVLRAHIPSHLESDLQKGSRIHVTVKFYVTVTHGSKTWKSKSKQSSEQVVEWNERVDALWEISYFVLLSTESPAVMYNNSPALQYLFMRKGPCGRTSLLEGRR